MGLTPRLLFFPPPAAQICERLGVHKVETIGDAYLAATGCIPHASGDDDAQANALRLAQLALAMQAYCTK